MPLQIFIPAEVTCDSSGCDSVCELAWAIDPREMAKQKKPFGQKQMTEIAESLAKAAMNEGWLVDRAGCYCPECKAKIEAGEVRPRISSVTAAGLIDELRFAAKTRKGGNDVL